MKPLVSVIGLVAFLGVGCATERGAPGVGFAGTLVGAGTAQLGSSNPDRSVIRTATIEVSVQDVVKAAPEVVNIADSVGGYVEQSSTGKDSGATLRLRVPSDSLDQVLDQIAALGKEQDRQVSSTDVTEQVADLEAALKNNKALRKRLRELLGRAKTVDEVLRIERELTRIQTQIDQQEGRLKRLRSQVSMSVVTVHLDRKEILGPLGYAVKGAGWLIEKLFVIQ